jgi:pimeloyl-ACP methyl ester carboxylesterase
MLHRVIKVFVYGLVCVVALIGAVTGSALGYRAYRQHQNGSALRIHSSNGIEEARFVDIGGLRQWIQIRGDDKDNPVILFVHGGPALSMIPFTYRSMRPWEQYFTVVHWDQRGAGRTYLLNGGADDTASGMDQIIDDGIRVSEFVRARLHKDKIVLVGESWGSAVALEMARARPDIFYAYVGTGQAINMPRAEGLTYQLLLARVRSENDERAIHQLEAIGPSPYADPSRRILEQRILAEHPAKSERVGVFDGMGGDFMSAPGYSLRESYQLIAGATQHRAKLVEDDQNYSAARRGMQFEIPVFFFQGSEDIQAPTQLVAEYLRDLTAPAKELVIFPGGGHNSYYFYSERFLGELRARLGPVAGRGGDTRSSVKAINYRAP